MKRIVDFIFYKKLCDNMLVKEDNMKDIGLLLVIIDDMIDATKNIEDIILVSHTIN